MERGTRERGGHRKVDHNETVAAVRRFIEKNWNQRIALEAIAQHTGYGQHHIWRVFKSATGITPLQYQIKLKVDEAKRRLADPGWTEKSLTDLAIECGFFDQAHFIRFFKRHTRMTPSEYQRKRGDDPITNE